MPQSRFVLFQRFLLPTLILMFVTVYFLEVQGLSDPRDRMLITPVFWIMLFSYPIIIFQEWKKWKAPQQESADEEDHYEVHAKFTKKVAYFMISIFLYLVLINYLGFILVTLLFLPSLMRLLGTKDWRLLSILPVGVTVTLYLLFVTWLGIPLPKGFLF